MNNNSKDHMKKLNDIETQLDFYNTQVDVLLEELRLMGDMFNKENIVVHRPSKEEEE